MAVGLLGWLLIAACVAVVIILIVWLIASNGDDDNGKLCDAGKCGKDNPTWYTSPEGHGNWIDSGRMVTGQQCKDHYDAANKKGATLGVRFSGWASDTDPKKSDQTGSCYAVQEDAGNKIWYSCNGTTMPNTKGWGCVTNPKGSLTKYPGSGPGAPPTGPPTPWLCGRGVCTNAGHDIFDGYPTKAVCQAACGGVPPTGPPPSPYQYSCDASVGQCKIVEDGVSWETCIAMCGGVPPTGPPTPWLCGRGVCTNAGHDIFDGYPTKAVCQAACGGVPPTGPPPVPPLFNCHPSSGQCRITTHGGMPFKDCKAMCHGPPPPAPPPMYLCKDSECIADPKGVIPLDVCKKFCVPHPPPGPPPPPRTFWCDPAFQLCVSGDVAPPGSVSYPTYAACLPSCGQPGPAPMYLCKDSECIADPKGVIPLDVCKNFCVPHPPSGQSFCTLHPKDPRCATPYIPPSGQSFCALHPKDPRCATPYIPPGARLASRNPTYSF